MTTPPLPPIVRLDPTRLDDVLARTPGLLVLDFWAPWCPPCVVLLGLLAEIAPDFAGRVTFLKFNVDDDSRRAVTMGIRGVPTLIFFQDGVEIERLVGTESLAALRRRLERLLDGSAA